MSLDIGSLFLLVPLVRVLFEQIVRLGKPESVDRAKGILFGAKILGLESINKRRYTPEAVQQALAQRLYEGCAVNTNHPKKPDDPRDAEDRFGWFENVRPANDGGVKADFHLLDPTEPLAVKLMNAAEMKPDLFGFSHNAEGDGYTDADGVFVVESITRVRSVDLVAEPATTGGIWEQVMKHSLRQFLEAVAPKVKAIKKPTPASKRIGKFLEDMGKDDLPLMDDVDMGAPAAEDKDWKGCLNDAIAKLTASEDPAEHDLAQKLLKMLRPEEAIEEEEDPEEEDKPMAGGEDDEEEKKDKVEGRKKRTRRKHADPIVAQLQEEVAGLRKDKSLSETKAWLREQVDKRKLDYAAPLEEACLALAERGKITAHLDWLQKQIPPKVKPMPRAQMPTGFTEERYQQPNVEGKSFAERARILSSVL